MDEQLEFVKLIASRLDSVGIPYMMTGSMAMAIYSVPRMTRDIDLVVEVKPVDVDKIVSLFSKDCYIDRDSVRQAVDAHSMFNIIHNEWVVKADFIIRKDEEYRREEFARRQKVVIEDMTIFVVSVEDLILSKLAWGKKSQSDLQLRDARQILSTVLELDWEYMKKWAVFLGIDALLEKAKENG
jgi:predicted nucleotidyltransferase